MPIRVLAVIALLLLPASPASAHGPTPQKAEETVTIAAPPDAVWAVVADFAGLASWHPMVTDCAADSAADGGLRRTLTINGGGLVESLDDRDAAARRLSYRLLREDVSVLPVSFYSATISVDPAGGGGSTVVWSGRFYRGDTGNYPTEDMDDNAARTAMTAFFRTGLDGLKAFLETR
ncbi:SRPBCC family protein [Azospirillum halopraeferens]|uniref:SRPBCC family protein n=1 Tax=Azospirillum halopraeferens TaxID=34010 RepID=UPI0004288017|nr:SRPBCC family protein [Azospirillum halopraeferens]